LTELSERCRMRKSSNHNLTYDRSHQFICVICLIGFCI
jgi:hypothetical protein